MHYIEKPAGGTIDGAALLSSQIGATLLMRNIMHDRVMITVSACSGCGDPWLQH